MLGSRRVTTYIEEGEEYDVVLEGAREDHRTPADLSNIHVRSQRSGELTPLANLVSLEEIADSIKLNRYNRVRAITVTANLTDQLALGDALDCFDRLVEEHLSPQVIVDYKGQTQDLKATGE